MTTWLYLFTKHGQFPDPLAEIGALHAILEEEGVAYLLLSDRKDPPGKGAAEGEEFMLCTRLEGGVELIKHGAGVVEGSPAMYPATPGPVLSIYGETSNRWFLPIRAIELFKATPVTELSADEQAAFAAGQAYVRRVEGGTAPPRRAVEVGSSGAAQVAELPRRVPEPQSTLAERVHVIGLDPTAGTWESGMTTGPKPMPSVLLVVEPNGQIRAGAPLRTLHSTNDEFLTHVERSAVRVTCIDGPCATNGPRVRKDLSGWEAGAPDRIRTAEAQLAREGVGLFWTTRATTEHFDGASRWIARSLQLFRALSTTRAAAIETHPHGAFTFLWRASRGGLLARKTTPDGRAQRLAMLRSWIADLDGSQLPDHDCVDAAAAALVAALHVLGQTHAGASVIYQATFLADGWRGHADFLHRVEQPSALGAFSYEPWDTKLARDAHASALMQLCAYADLIATVQGRQPEYAHVVLGGPDRPVESYRVAALAPYFRQVRGQFLARMTSAVAPVFPVTDPYPDPCAHCDVCDWSTVCDQRWRKDDYVALVAGITRNQRMSLRARGVTTLAALSELSLPVSPPLDRTSPVSVERIREQARVQRLGREQKAPVHELVKDPGEGMGLEALPEPSPGDLFFDIEGDPFVGSQGREYLFGVVEPALADPGRAAGTPKYHELWGFDAAGERRAFEALVDLIVARRAEDPCLHVYHYAPYEPSALKRLAARLGTRVEEVDDLLRGGTFVDLYRVVRQSVRASVESYSIKKLEPFYDFTREMDLRASGDARAALEVWLETGGTTPLPGHDEIVDKVRLYNRDDCLSVWKLRDWLESLRAEAARALGAELPRRTPPTPTPSEEATALRAELEVLKDRLCGDVPPEREARTDEQHARWLLAQLIEWHWREDKSTFWEYFRMRDLDEQELLEEPKPIGGLVYEGIVGKAKRSSIHRYRFPAQEHDLRADSPCREARTNVDYTIHALDADAGTLDLTRGEKSPPPEISALIPFERVRTPELQANLRALAEWTADNGIEGDGPSRAVRDLLMCRPPGAGQGTDAPLALPDEDTSDAAVRLVLAMTRSERGGVLPIQGPPGAGKTRTGARMILELVKAGFKVGVTANSHAVIGNLLSNVCKLARDARTTVAIVQKPGSEGKGALDDPFVTVENNAASIKQSLVAGDARVVGGTAWLWAGKDMRDAVDVLFVDEAGQMALANTVAMGPSTRCLVLLGDPQQLDQPTKGVHPEGAGASALEHLLAGAPTMPAHRGLFLEKTWRLNPAICAFTSEMFYEGRLGSRPGLEAQVLHASAPWGGAGLRWCGVEHTGNQNESPEEVTAIRGIVDALLGGGSTWVNVEEDETPELTLRDILIVAPYNAQVRALIAALPTGARVGTVDKFQGQEAPVVIYSLTTSTPEDAPRGMDFLYSLNRLNVATSRARCVAIVVGSPALLRPSCRTPLQMMQAAALCRVAELGVARG